MARSTSASVRPFPVPPPSVEDRIRLYLSLKAQEAQITKQLEGLRAELLEAAVQAHGAIETPVGSVKVVEQERKTIKADKLLALGVTPKIIAKATDVTNVSFVRVTASA